MGTYRIYTYSLGVPPSSQVDVACADDHDAILAAEKLIAAGGSADVWEATRYVRRVITSSQRRGGSAKLGALFDERRDVSVRE